MATRATVKTQLLNTKSGCVSDSHWIRSIPVSHAATAVGRMWNRLDQIKMSLRCCSIVNFTTRTWRIICNGWWMKLSRSIPITRCDHTVAGLRVLGMSGVRGLWIAGGCRCPLTICSHRMTRTRLRIERSASIGHGAPGATGVGGMKRSTQVCQGVGSRGKSNPIREN